MEYLAAVLERDGDWWIAYVEEIPGANGQGRTLDEARENLADATLMMFEIHREIAREMAKGRDVLREEPRQAIA